MRLPANRHAYLQVSPPREQRHTIIIRMPSTFTGPNAHARQILQHLVREIADRAGLPPKAAVVRGQMARGRYNGYIFVARGPVTPAAKRRLRRTVRIATNVTRKYRRYFPWRQWRHERNQRGLW